MKTRSVPYLGMLRMACIASVLILAAGYTSQAKAAQGCGYGFHKGFFGCTRNHPGFFSRPAPDHPGCWRNFWGSLRCP